MHIRHLLVRLCSTSRC